ncbi:TolC family protein [Nibrella saemangeumensis]
MRFSLILFLLVSPYALVAQQLRNPAQRAVKQTTLVQQGEQLTLPEAISSALEKNYSIRISRAQERIANNNNTYGNAGFFPLVTANLQRNYVNQNLRQEFFNALQPPQRIYGVNNNNLTVGPSVQWTIFNGLGMFIAYDRLNELVRLGEANTRANVEATVADITTAYYDVIRQLQRLLAFRQALDISGDRLELAKANYEVGTRSRVDFLSAQVDYNADSAAYIAQEQAVRNSKILLNTLLVRDPNTEFAVRDTILVRTDLALENLRQSVLANNPQLVVAALNRRVAYHDIRLLQAQQLPQVDLLATYNFIAQNNEAGFGIRQARNDVLTYGIRISVPIFNGLNQRRLIQNAKINSMVTEYQEADQRLQLQSQLDQTFNQYQNSLKLVNLEVQNYQIAIQNVDIAYERYRVGNSTAVEFRDVQRNAVAAQTRLIDALFNAKAAEIELLRLSSTIVQNVR